MAQQCGTNTDGGDITQWAIIKENGGGRKFDLTRSCILIGLAIYPQYTFLWIAYLTILKVMGSGCTLEVCYLLPPFAE